MNVPLSQIYMEGATVSKTRELNNGIDELIRELKEQEGTQDTPLSDHARNMLVEAINASPTVSRMLADAHHRFLEGRKRNQRKH